MNTTLFEKYKKSIQTYEQAQAFLHSAEEEKKSLFQKIIKYLHPIVIKELTSTNSVQDYYIKGAGRIVIIDFFLKEKTIDIFYGLLAEDDIFPSKTNTLTLHLFNF